MENMRFDVGNENEFQRCLEKLVDGELSEAHERELIATLENRVGGWRQCALAFLEAHALRREFSGLVNDGTTKRDNTPVTRPAGRHTSFRWRRALSLAAAVLLAFTLGFVVNGTRNSNGLQTGEQIVAQTNSVQTDAAANAQEWQTMKVTLPSANGDAEQTVEVPLVNADKETLKSLLAEQDPVLSDVAVQALQQTGHRVQQHRTYYPVKLDDGREAVLPMDVVEVEYTGGWQ